MSGRSVMAIGLTVFLVIGVLVYLGNAIHYVDKHELGFTFDRFNGKIEKVPHAGWVVRNPFRYAVSTVDLRPYQVSITAMMGISQRILNAKLVRFNPDGLDTFIAWHGRKAGGSVSALTEILKCYAFDKQGGKDCPFVIVVSELSPDQGAAVLPPQENE